MRALASQAAVAVENNLLYESIERLFEGFVTAAVTAIEQRDPTTSGHSFRVADLTVELAKVVDRIDRGQFADVRFTSDQIREIRYASLLHDFGKVGVREQVLVKEKKLYPMQLDNIRGRFEFLMKAVENDANRQQDRLPARERPRRIRRVRARRSTPRRRRRFASCRRTSRSSRSRTSRPCCRKGTSSTCSSWRTRDYVDIRGERRLLVDPEEARILSIRKGNLDAGGAHRDREPRHAHVQLPAEDPLDARPRRRRRHRLRASREAQRPRLPAQADRRRTSRSSRG